MGAPPGAKNADFAAGKDHGRSKILLSRPTIRSRDRASAGDQFCHWVFAGSFEIGAEGNELVVIGSDMDGYWFRRGMHPEHFSHVQPAASKREFLSSSAWIQEIPHVLHHRLAFRFAKAVDLAPGDLSDQCGASRAKPWFRCSRGRLV